MFLWRDGTVGITGGFCLLTAWFAWANGWRLLLTVLAAAAVHEAGHCLMLRYLGVPVTGLYLSAFGAEMAADCRGLSYGQELAAVLAGPAANLLWGMGLAAWGENWAASAGAQMVLCAFNLLPIRPLDGGRALALAVTWFAGPAAGEWAVRWIGGGTALLLAAGVIVLMSSSGGSLWLLPAAVALLIAAVRELCGVSQTRWAL